MEIITWVLSGSLLHEDSTGDAGVVYPGLAQRISAGSGIVHAERNDAFRLDSAQPEVPVRFVQRWVRPDARAGPSYAQQRDRDVGPGGTGCRWPRGGIGRGDPLGSKTSTLWVTTLTAGSPGCRRLRVRTCSGTGQVEVESVGVLGEGDALRVIGVAKLWISGGCRASCWSGGWRREHGADGRSDTDASCPY